MFDPLTLVSALLPVATHGASALVDHLFNKEPTPATIDDLIKLRTSNVQQAQALAALDNADGTSTWVKNVRGMQRPVATAVILLVWGLCVTVLTVQPELMDNVAQLASCAVFYLFGDRTIMYARGKK